MSKKEMLILNSDNSSNISEGSGNSNHQKETDIETESEKKNRLSLKKALTDNNYSRAFEKINANISAFCSNIQLLQDYSLCLGSKLDSKEKGSEIDKIILVTADEIAETFYLIKIIKNFEYKDRNQKIQNITQANRMEEECNKYKKIFDDLTDKIKQQNLNLINQARSSIRYSNYSDFSGEIHLDNDEPTGNTGFKNGKEFLDGIEMKRKQNDAIYKATKKIERTLNKKNILTFNIKDNNDNKEENENNMEIFNIEYNYKKNDLQNNLLPNNSNNNNPDKNNIENSYTIMSNSQSRTSKAFHEMEDKVFIALEGPRQNFIRRHWVLTLTTLLLIIILFSYMFIYKKK